MISELQREIGSLIDQICSKDRDTEEQLLQKEKEIENISMSYYMKEKVMVETLEKLQHDLQSYGIDERHSFHSNHIDVLMEKNMQIQDYVKQLSHKDEILAYQIEQNAFLASEIEILRQENQQEDLDEKKHLNGHFGANINMTCDARGNFTDSSLLQMSEQMLFKDEKIMTLENRLSTLIEKMIEKDETISTLDLSNKKIPNVLL